MLYIGMGGHVIYTKPCSKITYSPFGEGDVLITTNVFSLCRFIVYTIYIYFDGICLSVCMIEMCHL